MEVGVGGDEEDEEDDWQEGEEERERPRALQKVERTLKCRGLGEDRAYEEKMV